MPTRDQPGRHLVPVLKQFFELAVDVTAREPSSEKPKRQRILHFVFQNAGGGTIRLKAMRVFPVGEWSRNLKVAEIAVLLIVLMHGDPAHAKGPAAKAHHYSRSAFDSSGSLNNLDVFARRSKHIQGIRQGVPRVHL